MNKKVLGLVVSAVAVFALSGCGGGGTDVVYVEPEPEYVTLFLIDDLTGLGADHVPYICYDPDGAIVTDSFTTIDGEFTFIAGDDGNEERTFYK